jgi:hypothetical protein
MDAREFHLERLFSGQPGNVAILALNAEDSKSFL